MTPRGHPERLSDASDEDLLSLEMQLQGSDWRGEGDVWRLLCDADPHRALRALASAPDDGDRRRPDAISALLAASGKVDDGELEAGIADFLSKMPADATRTNTSPIAAWVSERSDLARAHGRRPMDGLFALCDHVARAVFAGVAPHPSRARGRSGRWMRR